MLDIVVSYHCIFVYIAISRKTTEPNLREWEKTSFGPDFGPFGASKFFFKNLAPSVTRYHVQLSSCTTSEKTNDPVLRKLRDRQINRGTDRRE